MTVASETRRSGPYFGNGVATVFNYDFRILSEQHIRVILGNADGTEATLILGTDYTVSGVGNAAGGTVTKTVPLAEGETITLLRSVPLTQETDLVNQGAYYAETVEDALDLAIMRDQQMQEQIDRAIKAPVSTSGSGAEIAEKLVVDIGRLAMIADEIDQVADIREDVSAVAGISPQVSLVAGVADAIKGTASAVKITEKLFTGDGVTEVWQLDRTPGAPENVLVWENGVVQNVANYSVEEEFLTISPPVANGVEIRTLIVTLLSGGGGGGGGDGGDADTLNGEDGVYYLSRENHSGTQGIDTIEGLATALAGKVESGHGHGMAEIAGLLDALGLKAPTISPEFTGDPTAPTQPALDNSTKLATTAHVKAAISASGGGGPGGSDAATLGGQDGDYYRNRENHTGTQAIATVAGLEPALDGLNGALAGVTPQYMTEAAFAAASIAAPVLAVRVAGYYAPGDGGGHLKVRISTPSPVKPWHKQSADGAWWEIRESAVTPQMFGAKADFNWSSGSGTDDTTAIRAAVAYGGKVVVPQGQYRVTGEIELVTAGQVLEFENSGGYGYGSSFSNWAHNTAFVATGTFTRRVRTRRLHRASSGSPQDAPLSVVLNLQAEGIHLIRPCVRLYCNYSNSSSTNFGDNCDVGIFVGCRVGTQMRDPIVLDYFRVCGIYFDVSGGTGMPRFNAIDGSAYPSGTVLNGADGTHLINPFVKGPRIGLGVIGAKPAAGQSGYGPAYYDAVLGGAVTDTRGSFGFSDFLVVGGRIYGPDHHSNRRLANPTRSGGVLNQTSLQAEPDFMPAAMWIDGLAGNSSGSVWGMNFLGPRFATIEAFRVRLGRCSRTRFYGCHIEGRDGGRMDTAGNPISTNDYSLHCYGDICSTSDTGRVIWFGSDAQSLEDGLQHNYGESLRVTTDSGREYFPTYIAHSKGEFDIRALEGYGIRFRSGQSTIGTLDKDGNLSVTGTVNGGSAGGGGSDPTFGVVSLNTGGYIRHLTGALDLRAATSNNVTLRAGNSTLATFFASGNAQINGNLTVTGTVTSSGGGSSGGSQLEVYTAAQIASKSHSVNTSGKSQGKMVWDSTNFRIMVAGGAASTSSWRVADGSASVVPA